MSKEVRLTLIKSINSLLKCVPDLNTNKVIIAKSHLDRSSVNIMQFVHPINRSGFFHRERAQRIRTTDLAPLNLLAVFITYRGRLVILSSARIG